MYYTKTLKTISLKISEPEAEKETTLNSRQCFRIAKEIYKTLDDDQEHFTVFFLNSQNEINGFKTLFSGGQSFATVDLKIIYRNALQFGASAIIAIHNHPAGSLKRSGEDDKITQEIINAGKLLNIKLLDHLILGNGEYYSYADEGLIETYNRKGESCWHTIKYTSDSGTGRTMSSGFIDS